MTPSLLQVPPSPTLDRSAARNSHRLMGDPPAAGIFLTFPSAKNPMYWLSGDQNGNVAPSLRSNRRSVGEFSERIHKAFFESEPKAVSATCRPSGDGAA